MRKAKPTLELLENRITPTVFGNPWPEPEHLTLSFAPDGAQVSGRANVLFQKLDAAMPRQTWQREILKAFQTWAQHGNINLNVVDDNGQAFGALFPGQGSGLHGDIRIAAVPLSHSELAAATPFDLLSDWTGDVLFNSAYDFDIGGTSAHAYDLFTVALQEAGHVFGLPNDPSATSAMHSRYLGVRAGPSAADIANLQALYGARLPDRFDATGPGNNSPSTATAIRFVYDADQLRGLDPSQTTPPWVVHGDLTTRNDVDFHRFQLPADLNDFRVELRTSGISLLNARVTVLNSSLQAVQTTSATDPMNGNLALFVSNASPNGIYYVKVESSQPNAFGIGDYHLAVGKEAHEALFPSLPSYINDDSPDDDEDSELGPLVPLTPRVGQVGPQWDYTYRASISHQGDKDRYLVTAPTLSTGTASTMVVTVQALETGRLNPRVTVYSTNPTPQLVEAQVLRNDRGFHTVQIVGVSPGSAYEIRIEADDPLSSFKEGNYLVGVDFVSSPVALETFAQGTATQTARQRAHRLELFQTRLLHFTLSADIGSSTIESAVRLTIYNQNHQAVLTLTARAGETTSADILLAPGTYTLRFAAAPRNASAVLPPLFYHLRGIIRNDPIGPTLVSPSSNPLPPPQNIYTWYDLFLIPPWIVLEDAYSDPWSGL